MKLGKVVLSTLLLAACAVSGFVVGNGNVKETSAMNSVTNDPDIDVGMNIKVSKGSGSWTESTFLITQLESANASSGDYLAVRMKGNNGAGSYFNVFPNNVSGNAFMVPIATPVSGVKFIPAGPAGVAWDYSGGRTWDLPMNFGYDWDGWFCIPKTEFTRKRFGDDASFNWNINLYSIYFIFYGKTPDDTIDFDIGNIYTANIVNNHLVKVNRLVNWADINGFTGVGFLDDAGTLLHPTRNNENLKPAVKFIQSIENVNSCSESEASTAYTANKDTHDALDTDNLAYLDTAIIADHATKAPTDGKTTGWTAAHKWDQICETAGHPNHALMNIPFIEDKNKSVLGIIIISSIAVLSAGVLFLYFRKRKVNN